jgi:hypothetical protein
MSIDETVILFLREMCEGGTYLNRFSVASQTSRQVNSRAIVSHEGSDRGDGEWTCTKDGGGKCLHIKVARDHLQKLLQKDPDASAEALDEVIC